MIKRTAVLLLWAILAAPLHAAVYTVFSDNGAAGTNVFAFPQPSVFLSSVAVPAGAGVPEGQYSMSCQGSPFDGWGVFYDLATGINLTAFDGAHNGVLRFWLYTTTPNLTLSLEHINPGTDCQGLPGRDKDCFNLSGPLTGQLNKWVMLQVPMSFISRVDDLYSPFELTANSGGLFYVDNVHYIDNILNPTTDAPAVFSVAVKNIGNQQPAAGLTWNNGSQVALPAGWARSDQYIELTIDSIDQFWGVQIYTNNTSAGAAPQYVANGSSNPAGLVNAGARTLTIPLAWSVKAGTQTAAAAAPAPANPNNAGDRNSFQWIFMKDALTPNIPAENTTAFIPGELPVTVKNNAGIHFGQRNTDFGAETPPNYIFLEADFGAALAQSAYQTNTLTLEFFTL